MNEYGAFCFGAHELYDPTIYAEDDPREEYE